MVNYYLILLSWLHDISFQYLDPSPRFKSHMEMEHTFFSRSEIQHPFLELNCLSMHICLATNGMHTHVDIVCVDSKK